MGELVLSLVAIVLHEAGHIAAAKVVGAPVRSFSIKAVGASLRFDFCGISFGREALVHLGGPLTGGASAIIALLIFGERGRFFCGISTVLSAVNLLPIKGFDGGGVLSCVLASFCLPDRAERISSAVSFSFLMVLWAAVLWIELRVGANLSLLAFVLFFMLKVE